jgi:glycosyltransferase involved in cell wall biosynthesis
LRILLDYRPALRHPTGVGGYAHHLALALQAQLGEGDALTLFSSSWKDRLPPDAVAGASSLDLRVPVRLLNLAWHRLEWPPVELLGAGVDVTWSLHPLLMPSRRAVQFVTVHDLYFLDRPGDTAREVRRDYPALAGAHARRAAGVIVNSAYTRDQVVSRLQVPSERVTVCHPGAPAWPRRAGPSARGPILHVGTIEPRKNVGAILAAYAELLERDPSAPPLVFAGRMTGTPPPAPSGVRWLGYITDDERLRLYREASMLVIASADEGFGIPALEAITIGLPVVAAARGSLPEVVGEAGLLVDADDPRALAAAMQRVLEEGLLRVELADRGVARARRFTWGASAAQLLEAFRAGLARRGRAA